MERIIGETLLKVVDSVNGFGWILNVSLGPIVVELNK
jgi:hypothetical protein